ncbi:MAG: hypothetical protein IPP50_19855, partial [Piscinibacter sp.]|nr:hypothetical protein [Piscinibacter sp.]
MSTPLDGPRSQMPIAWAPRTSDTLYSNSLVPPTKLPGEVEPDACACALVCTPIVPSLTTWSARPLARMPIAVAPAIV